VTTRNLVVGTLRHVACRARYVRVNLHPDVRGPPLGVTASASERMGGMGLASGEGRSDPTTRRMRRNGMSWSDAVETTTMSRRSGEWRRISGAAKLDVTVESPGWLGGVGMPGSAL